MGYEHADRGRIYECPFFERPVDRRPALLELLLRLPTNTDFASPASCSQVELGSPLDEAGFPTPGSAEPGSAPRNTLEHVEEASDQRTKVENEVVRPPADAPPGLRVAAVTRIEAWQDSPGRARLPQR